MQLDFTEYEAEQLIKNPKALNVEKHDNNKRFLYPIQGGILNIDVIDEYKNEFIVGIRQRKIELIKRSHVLRYAKSIILVRVDFDKEHCNPDGEKIGVPHVHIYKEGFNDKYAYSLDKIGITIENHSDINELLSKFLDYINVKNLQIDTRYQAEVFDHDE